MGNPAPAGSYRVADAVESWLASLDGSGKSASTVAGYRSLAKHITAADGIGGILVKDLRVSDVQKFLIRLDLSARCIKIVLHILQHSLDAAEADDLVMRNVARNKSITVPEGRPGRPSKSLALAQAEALLAAATESGPHAYVVISLMSGARTEAVRAMRWDHVDLAGDPDAIPPVPPSIAVWRADRVRGETKTRTSKRTLAIPPAAAGALRAHQAQQDQERVAAGSAWQESGLVFTTPLGTGPLNRWHVRREFRKIIKAAGIAGERTPREPRHSFVSILSASGVPLEDISRLVGHASTQTTQLVHSRDLRPVLEEGATVMGAIFRPAEEELTAVRQADRHLGGQAKNSGGDRGHRHSCQLRPDQFPCQDHNRPGPFQALGVDRAH